MKPLKWNLGKNSKLKEERGIGFEIIEAAVLAGHFDICRIRSRNHKGQKGFVVRYQWKTWVAPFRESNEAFFLHTIFEDD